MNEENEKRLIANQIIVDLFNAKATSQIQILLIACARSIEELDPESYRKYIEEKAGELK